MSELIDLQNDFQQCLVHSSCELKHIVATEKVSTEIRLGIYVHAYYSRLIDALATSYPILQKYLGIERFNHLAYEYIKQHPSTFRSIRWFGDDFAKFLQEQQLEHYLSELAQFEWTLCDVFDAADSNIISIEEIAAIAPDAWGDMRFTAHPSVRRINFSWNAVSIWQALSEDKSAPQPIESSEPVAWIMWRKDLVNQFTSLTADEAWAVDAMLAQSTFEEICEGLCEWMTPDKVALHAATLLKNWIYSGFIAQVGF